MKTKVRSYKRGNGTVRQHVRRSVKRACAYKPVDIGQGVYFGNVMEAHKLTSLPPPKPKIHYNIFKPNSSFKPVLMTETSNEGVKRKIYFE
jgi:hypothetical protein